ncbi:KID repeat protein [Campylobacter jejuni]|nr:KID repeat protein [Campylobacter jejuni]
MQGNTVRNYYVSEGVKALFSIYFKDQTEENFIKALNEFGKENQINSQEIKDEALREIKEELSKLATTDLLNARIDTVDAKIDKVEASLNAKIDKVEASLNARIDKVEASLNAKIDKVEASLNAKIDKVENKLDSFKTEVKTYVIILAVLMFILQPTIFDLIKSIFK